MGMLNIAVAPDMSYQCRCNVCSLMKMLQSVFQGSGGVANANVAARREINAKIRLNKILLRCKLDKILMASDIGLNESKSICEKVLKPSISEMKGSLKKFIDLTAELQEGHSPKEGSPYGYLIQVSVCLLCSFNGNFLSKI